MNNKSKFVSDSVIRTIQNGLSSGDYRIDKYSCKGYSSYAIGKIRLSFSSGKVSRIMDTDVSKDYVKEWNYDVGGILSSELKKSDCWRLYEVVGVDYKALLYMIPDESMGDINERGMLHIKNGDYCYTVLKAVPIDSEYSHEHSRLGIYEDLCEDVEEGISESASDDEYEQTSYELF